MDESPEVGSEIDGIIEGFTPMGAKVKIGENRRGLLFNNEIFKQVQVGDKVKVYIKKIHEDGKVDLSLERSGYKNFINESTQKILDELEKSRGFLPFTDKSSPEAIKRKFQMSKKRFKDSVGALYRNKQIELRVDGIKLI